MAHEYGHRHDINLDGYYGDMLIDLMEEHAPNILIEFVPDESGEGIEHCIMYTEDPDHYIVFGMLLALVYQKKSDDMRRDELVKVGGKIDNEDLMYSSN